MINNRGPERGKSEVVRPRETDSPREDYIPRDIDSVLADLSYSGENDEPKAERSKKFEQIGPYRWALMFVVSVLFLTNFSEIKDQAQNFHEEYGDEADYIYDIGKLSLMATLKIPGAVWEEASEEFGDNNNPPSAAASENTEVAAPPVVEPPRAVVPEENSGDGSRGGGLGIDIDLPSMPNIPIAATIESGAGTANKGAEVIATGIIKPGSEQAYDVLIESPAKWAWHQVSEEDKERYPLDEGIQEKAKVGGIINFVLVTLGVDAYLRRRREEKPNKRRRNKTAPRFVSFSEDPWQYVKDSFNFSKLFGKE